jgi:hypothetical protein
MEFVNFKIAKKLKEKGFTLSKNEIIAKFNSDGVWHSQLYCNYYETMDNEEVISPTISQVLKWLRVEKNIICLPHIDPIEEKWFFYVTILPQASDFPEYMSSIIYNNYEDAALAGVEYVLDNLI